MTVSHVRTKNAITVLKAKLLKNKRGFTLIEVMTASAMLLLLVAGFTRIADQTVIQIQLRKQKNGIASQLDQWSDSVLRGNLSAGSYRENKSWQGINAELHWKITTFNAKLKTVLFEVRTSGPAPEMLAQWKTSVKVP